MWGLKFIGFISKTKFYLILTGSVLNSSLLFQATSQQENERESLLNLKGGFMGSVPVVLSLSKWKGMDRKF